MIDGVGNVQDAFVGRTEDRVQLLIGKMATLVGCNAEFEQARRRREGFGERRLVLLRRQALQGTGAGKGGRLTSLDQQASTKDDLKPSNCTLRVQL